MKNRYEGYMKQDRLDEVTLDEIKTYLDELSEVYYNTSDTPELTDEEFDMLLKKYEQYRSYSGGAVPKDSGKRLVDLSHSFPELVGTLSKTNNLEELHEWINKESDRRNAKELIITPKYDGNSVVLTFNHNMKLKNAITRGKEGKGVDLSDLFDHVQLDEEFKKYITDDKTEIGIKCEVIMSFETFNEVYHDKYANPRSVIAGILSSKEGHKYKKDLLLAPLTLSINDQDDLDRLVQLEELSQLGIHNEYFSIPEYNVVDNNESSIKNIYDMYINDREDLDFMIDGIVIEVKENSLRKSLGRQKDRNNYDVALKFPYMTKKTTVKGINFYQGNTGRVTPVVYFEPVYFNGAKCENVSIANYRRFKELSLAEGDEVIIEYRNDVLAYLIPSPTNTNEGEPIKFLQECEVCGNPLEVNENETFVHCVNSQCQTNVIGRLTKWVTSIDIKGLNKKTLERLNAEGIINDVSDLYKIKKEDLKGIEGIKDKSAKNIIESICSKDVLYDYEVFGSLSFDGIGKSTAKEIFKKYDISELDDNMDKLNELDGIHDITANNFKEGYENNRDMINEIIDLIEVKSFKESMQSNKSDEEPMTICFTGIRDKDLKEQLELKGHKVTGSVSKNTDLVICKDINSTSSKLVKAKELGIKIVQYDEYIL